MIEKMTSMDRQWLVVESNEECAAYEEQMLRYNMLEGLLPMEVIFKSGGKRYRFSISGCHSLTERVERWRLTGKSLEELFWTMQETIFCCKRYLLQEDNFCVLPESIFFDNVTGKLRLCYVPGYQKKLGEQLTALSEWMLNHLDTEDPYGVYCGYMIHVLCRGENVDFRKILNVFHTYKEDKAPGAEPLAAEQTPDGEYFKEGRLPVERASVLAEPGLVYGDNRKERSGRGKRSFWKFSIAKK